LGWLWGAYQLAINRLWGGFDVALGWLWVALHGSSSFFILSSTFAPASLCPAIQLSGFHPPQCCYGGRVSFQVSSQLSAFCFPNFSFSPRSTLPAH
jgi:hypothetical protein